MLGSHVTATVTEESGYDSSKWLAAVSKGRWFGSREVEVVSGV